MVRKNGLYCFEIPQIFKTCSIRNEKIDKKKYGLVIMSLAIYRNFYKYGPGIGRTQKYASC